MLSEGRLYYLAGTGNKIVEIDPSAGTGNKIVEIDPSAGTGKLFVTKVSF